MLRLLRLLLMWLPLMIVSQSTTCGDEEYPFALLFVNTTDAPVYIAVSQQRISPYLSLSVYGNTLTRVDPGQKAVKRLWIDAYSYSIDEANAYVILYTQATLESHTLEELLERDMCDDTIVIRLRADGEYTEKNGDKEYRIEGMTYVYWN